MKFDVYSYRPAPPETWIEPMKEWARRLTATGQVTYSRPNGVTLCDPLCDRGALDAWMPIEFMRVQQDDGSWTLEPRREIADLPGVLIAWIDGAVYDGVAPRQLSDLLHCYRISRLSLEAHWEAGLMDALNGMAPGQIGASLN